jgi:hypothetical protein
MTPLCTGLCGPQLIEIMDGFALECTVDGFGNDGKY